MHSYKYYIFKKLNIETILVPLVAFFAPAAGILLTVGAFIALDTITGIWKSKKNKVPITSKGLSAVASKMFLYESVVLLSFLLDYFILGPILEMVFEVPYLITKVTGMLLIYIEMKSINENYKEVKGVNLWKEFKSLVSRTKEIKEDLKDLDK